MNPPPSQISNSLEPGEMRVCTHCIGSTHFSKWIAENGKRGKCDFEASHGRTHKVVSIEQFAIEVDAFFRENFQLGEEYPYATEDSEKPNYRQFGKPYEEILAGELECDSEIVDAISKNLPDASHYDIAQGDTAFYDDTANYERIADAEKRDEEDWKEHWYENRFSYQWRDFCEVVQYRRRLFNIKEPLDQLFGAQSEYEEGAIRPVYPLKTGTKLYRSRLLDNDFTDEQLKDNPARKLGAPPKDKARAGRMNVEYIPAFYGAFCKETAIAEIRPSIGDEVAVGEFVLVRDIRVFDFTAFSLRLGDKWRDAVSHTRYDFINQMQEEISRPISPFAMQREYIATQIVAEYLREYFACDAVIYNSSMHRDEKMDNRNIVILNKGSEFVGSGQDHVLAYSRYEIESILDVVYTLGGSIPF
ncbi:MAG TPA: RES family NAD+ phosphorylase [Xanthobacteraceae bacterium]|nr:RES family NAD+ phosphorylase [Xanthobacteraceae bacterium]